MKWLAGVWLGLLLISGAPAASPDDLARRTIILVNARQPESVALGEFYAQQRGIPTSNLVALPMPDAESITWREFIDQVWQPLQDELLKDGWLQGFAGSSLDPLGRRKVSINGSRLAYLVVCRGTPLRIHHDPALADPAKLAKIAEQFRTNQGAVDSELSLLALGNYEINAYQPNPLYAHEPSRSVNAELVVKVARLDGPTFGDARHLVASALQGEQHGLIGRYYVDFRGPYPEGDQWFETAQRLLDELGYDGDVDREAGTFGEAARFDAPAIYFGWYAGSLNGPMARDGFQFPPGAIALHLHSFSAETLRSSTDHWCGPLVARGVAATFGNVFEPYLQFTHRPDLIMQALSRGETLGDAAYFSLPALSWQSVLIGDPLYRPFKVSLEQQVKELAALPPLLAPYVVMRQAIRLEREANPAGALAALRAGMRQYPSLALALRLARSALAQRDEALAVGTLKFIPLLPKLRGEDWPLAREGAALLAKYGAAKEALATYALLASSGAPSPEARRALLVEARNAADDAGDLKRSVEFVKMLSETSVAPVQK